MSAATSCVLLASVANSKIASAPQKTGGSIPGQLSFLGFTLEKNTLEDVQAKLGISRTFRCTDQANEICYMGRDGTRVAFESGFSGAWTELDGYKIISNEVKSQCYRQCSASASVDKDVHTAAGLRLGLTRD